MGGFRVSHGLFIMPPKRQKVTGKGYGSLNFIAFFYLSRLVPRFQILDFGILNP
jgi:hypothetical protein